MSTAGEIARTFRAGMRRLCLAVAAIPDDRRGGVLFGGWTVREVLVHIACWDRELVRGLDQLLAGRRPAFLDEDENAFNERAVCAWREVPLDAVSAELRAAHESLMARLEALTDEQWRRSLAERWPDGAPITVASLFGYRYHGQTHYDGHAADIEAQIAN